MSCTFYYNGLVKLDKMAFENVAGKLCENLIPIKREYCVGRKGKSIAICTLASMKLLEDICKSDLMERVLIVGRLLSENRGIDTIVKFTLSNQELHHIIVCGKDVKGHQAGQALLALHAYGINNDKSGEGIIIAAKGHNPHLNSSKEDIDMFRSQIVKIHNLVGVDDVNQVREELEKVESMICT
jgi:tetrahydromethanopterin S-methyltransferase subunit A